MGAVLPACWKCCYREALDSEVESSSYSYEEL